MAIYGPTPGFKGRMFKLCVLTRWDFNFCVRSSPLGGGERDKEPRNHVKSVQNTDLGFALSFFFFLFFCSPSAADAHMSLSPSFSGLGKNSSCVCDSLASRPILIYNHAATKMHKKKLGSFLAFISLVYITLQCMGLSSFSLCMGKPGCLQLLCTTC